MVEKSTLGVKGLRDFPPVPQGFDPFAATEADLARFGLPHRPDPRKQPGLAALWDQRARRYQKFQHLVPDLRPADESPQASSRGLFPLETCGYERTSLIDPFLKLAGTWTVPNLVHNSTAGGTNDFRTFFGLGLLDVHVEMTVDAAQNITALVRIHDGTHVALPVSPGDTIGASLSLRWDATGTASYLLVNETTAQTVNFTIETGFPPAITVNAGISRGRVGGPPGPLARFGLVYFDQIIAWTTNGARLLTDGVPTTMVDSAGSILAKPEKLNDFAFRIIHEDD